MTAHRIATAAAVVVAAPLLFATEAQAHGAPTNPVSRVVACSPEGGSNTGTAACKAAVAANGAPFTAWDNLRVAGAGGRDRQVIRDGQLCSGGLPAYKGLDLARADWPSTRLKPGASMTMRYASTIPHTGTFKLYLTKQGYDPKKPLTWSDLPSKPFAQVTDPALTNGAYHIGAKLPADRTGRQVLYTIWQNSSTTDTYYSCSDVVFPSGSGEARSGSTAAASAASKNRKSSGSSTPSTSAASTPAAESSPATEPSAEAPGTSVPGAPAASTANPDNSGPSLDMLAGGTVAVVLATGAALSLRRRRRQP